MFYRTQNRAKYYLQGRRNALGKVKPLRTLKKRAQNNKITTGSGENGRAVSRADDRSRKKNEKGKNQAQPPNKKGWI